MSNQKVSQGTLIIFNIYSNPYTGIVLFIPQMSGATDKQKTISANQSYDDAITLIYETIGCAEVKRKPELSYKLSDSVQKASLVNLESDKDWMGLCEEVMARQKKKKATISVAIIVSTQVSSYI